MAREKQNILASQPCLHTLMKSLSANQSASTILVILLNLLNKKKNHENPICEQIFLLQ